MSNRVGARQSAHINQGVNEKTAGRMMRRRWGVLEHQLLSDSESVVCCATSEVGVWRRAGWFPSPRSPRSPRVCGPTGLGWTPFTTQSEGRAAEFPLPPPPPFSLSSLSLSASLSPPREQSRTRERRHVYVQRTDGHTPTLRTPWAPLKAKTNCCDYIFNIVPFSQHPHPYIAYLCYSGWTYKGLLST